jgi:integrase/recombinase XerC
MAVPGLTFSRLYRQRPVTVNFMGYATRTRRPPRTLTEEEQATLLRVSGEHREGFRDHLIFSLALGCGLRESEIVALDISDVSADGRRPRRTIHLRVFKRGGGNADPKAQRVKLPDGTFYKLEKYLRDLPAHAEGPLFVSRNGNRLSMRRVRRMCQLWQQRAGFDHPFSFHHLRHTAISNVQRQEKDIRLTQLFARHRSINTTLIYEHASDEQLARVTRRLAS